MAKVGSLVVDLAANTAKFQADLGKAAHMADKTMAQIRGYAGTAASAFRTLGIAGGVVAGGMLAMTKRSLETSERIVDLSRALGVGTQSLQSFQYAADLVGVSQETMEAGLQKLSVKVGDAARGNKTAAESFANLGVNIRDASGNTRDVGDIYTDLAKKIGGTADANKRASVAVEFFGKSGKDMVNALSPEFLRLAEDAKRIGAVIDDDLLRGAADAKDEFDAMSRVINAQVVSAFANLAPVLVTSAGLFEKLAQKVGDAFKSLKLEGATAELNKQAEIVNNLLTQIDRKNKLVTQGDPFAAGQRGKLLERLVEEQAKLDALRGGVEQQISPDKPKPGRPSSDTGSIGSAGGSPKKDKFRDELESLQREVFLIQERSKEERILFEIEQGRYGKLLPAQQEALLNEARTLDFYKESKDHLDELMKAEEAMTEEGKRLFTETRTPLEAFNLEVERLNELLKVGAIDLETYQRAFDKDLKEMSDQTKETHDEMSEFAKQAARNMQSHLADFLFDPFEDGLQGMLKGFVDTLRRMVAEAAAAKIFDAMGFGTGGGDKGGSGKDGFVADKDNGILTSIFKIGANIFGSGGGFPSFDVGTPYVPRDMIAKIHKGERIVPAEYNKPGGRGDTIQVYQTLTVQAGVAQTVRAEMMALLPRFKQEAIAGVIEAKQRGGRAGSAFG